jgi:AraC-like DNA-binding protein
MARYSLTDLQFPQSLDGYLMLADHAAASVRLTPIRSKHGHDEVELHLIARGVAIYLLGDRRLELRDGMMLWIPPGCEHMLVNADDQRLARWSLMVRARTVRRVLRSDAGALLRGADEPLVRSLTRPGARRLMRAYAEITEAASRGTALLNAGVAYALALSWDAFQHAMDVPPTATLHPAVARAVQLLTHPEDALSSKELARRCGLSESHLIRVFAQQIGMSVTEFRNRVRLERFFEIYGDGTRSTLSTASLEAGFGSYAQFHRVFRASMGHAPAEHRRALQGR